MIAISASARVAGINPFEPLQRSATASEMGNGLTLPAAGLTAAGKNRHPYTFPGAYYGVGVGVGVGVGDGLQVKSDSTRFPGRAVDALTSVQLPLVVTLYWSTLVKHLVGCIGPTLTKFPPQRNVAVIGPHWPVVWLLTKCHLPVP